MRARYEVLGVRQSEEPIGRSQGPVNQAYGSYSEAKSKKSREPYFIQPGIRTRSRLIPIWRLSVSRSSNRSRGAGPDAGQRCSSTRTRGARRLPASAGCQLLVLRLSARLRLDQQSSEIRFRRFDAQNSWNPTSCQEQTGFSEVAAPR